MLKPQVRLDFNVGLYTWRVINDDGETIRESLLPYTTRDGAVDAARHAAQAIESGDIDWVDV